MQPDLIYDVVLHRGYDTAHYLSKGYLVVAIYADPRMILHCRQQFTAEIAAGRLTIIQAGISDQPGPLPFYSSEHDDWNSFDPSIAKRNGTCSPIDHCGVRPLSRHSEDSRCPLLS